MKIKMKVEPLGSISATPKGYIRQFLCLDNLGEKCVVKAFSKNSDDLLNGGDRVFECDEFVFCPKA